MIQREVSGSAIFSKYASGNKVLTIMQLWEMKKLLKNILHNRLINIKRYIYIYAHIIYVYIIYNCP